MLPKLPRRWGVFGVGLLLLACVGPLHAEIPKNVILLIGDGMGFEHVEAASFFHGSSLSFEQFTHQGKIRTYTADSSAIGVSGFSGHRYGDGYRSQS